jgi:uncharacterized membrane protein YdbT with pleckstrin-like domain
VSNTSSYSENPAMFRSNPLGFILAVLLIAVAVGVLILLWWYLQCKSTKLEADKNTVMLERGLLSKERIELDIDKIRTVKVYQSLFNRMFGVGKISVYTSGDVAEFEIDGMPDPHRFRELVKVANT